MTDHPLTLDTQSETIRKLWAEIHAIEGVDAVHVMRLAEGANWRGDDVDGEIEALRAYLREAKAKANNQRRRLWPSLRRKSA